MHIANNTEKYAQNNMNFKTLIAAAALMTCFVSCKSYLSVPYFQDLKDPSHLPVLNVSSEPLKVRSGDRLNIVVSSALSPDMSAKWNLPLQSNRIGAMESMGSGSSYSTMPYIVDSNGDIDFPNIGKVRVAGLTREQIVKTITDIIVSRRLLNDAIVTCEVLNHYVNVLGDVRTPGRVQIDKDNLTLLEAISKCGDLNITGERQNVMVLRNEGGEQKVYQVDLTSAEDVYKSEAYYLHPDDVVYVNPNMMKQRTSTAAGNSWQTPSVYFSLTSIMLSVTTLIVSLTKK